MIAKLSLIALGGALGTLGRAGLTALVQRVAGADFPWGTLTVNLVGCFLFGVCWAVTESRLSAPPELRLVLLTGFMGAFTTFSTFVFDSQQLAAAARYGAFAANLIFQNGVGVGCLLLGLALGRALG